MSKLDQALELLKDLNIPENLQTELCAYCILALANLEEDSEWKDATNEWIKIHDIIQFLSVNYQKIYAENSRETIRKQAMHTFKYAALVENNGKATNSPNYSYRLTEETLKLFKTFNSEHFFNNLRNFLEIHPSLVSIYESKKKMELQPVKINGLDYTFSTGKHNQLQKAVIEQFAPRFAPYSSCLYVGDTTKKDLLKNVEKMKELGFEITMHDKLPDVVLYNEDKDWIYFIECVTSVGPVNPKRMLEITEMTSNVKSGKIFVTAFLDMNTAKKFIQDIAWETEIWVADSPEHMIHMNGDKFLGPR